MSGSTSEVPGFESRRNGETRSITANEPLPQEPAGPSEVTLPVVPTVIDAGAVDVDSPAEHPASVSTAIAVPQERQVIACGTWMRM
jgi:hypothetical protein